MLVHAQSPLKKKELGTSMIHNEDEDPFDVDFDEPDEIRVPTEIGTRVDFADKGSKEELIFPKNFEKPGEIPKKPQKMYDTTGLDRVDESRASPLKIFKYLSRPAENSLYEMDTTFSLMDKFEFRYEHPLLQEVYEMVQNEDEYMDQLPKKVFDDTYELLNNEDVSFMDGYNVLGVMFVLKKLMETFEINLSIDNNLNMFGGVSQSSEPLSNIMSSSLNKDEVNNPYYLNCPKVLTIYQLHLLCTNFNDSILVLHFKEEAFHRFSELKTDKSLLELVTKQLKEFIEETLNFNYKKQFFNEKTTITLSKISKSQKKILIELHLPFLQKGFLPDLVDCLQDALEKKYLQSFDHVSHHKIFRYCHMKADDLDLWGYKEFQEGVFMEEKVRGGMPYIKPKTGWFRFGFNVTNYYQTDCETDWFSNDNNPKEWAVCYCNIGLDSKLTTVEKDIYKELYNALDENGTPCGFGVLGTFQLGWLEEQMTKEVSLGISSWKKEDFSLEFFRLQLLEIMDVNFKSHKYMVALQCRVDPVKIRYPKKLEKRIFIVNDPNDLRPYGVLIKKLEA